MKKLLLILTVSFALSGCAAVNKIKEYWPKPHDPVMFGNLVTLNIEVRKVDCEKPDWSKLLVTSEHLMKYTEWRKDPQAKNMEGLHSHFVRMSNGGSKAFCEIGKNMALQRIDAAKTAWGER